MKQYSRTGYIAYQTTKIAELIDEGKFNIAKKIINELITEYSEDDVLKKQLARIYIFEQQYEKALEILNEILEKKVFMPKTMIYIKLNKEQELLELYKKYFKEFRIFNNKPIKSDQYKGLYIYLNKKYNPNFELEKSTLKYNDLQIYDYDREKAIEHIRWHHITNRETDKSLFNEDFNLEEAFDQIEEYVKNNDGHVTQNIIETYYFYSPNCGIAAMDKSLTSYICVCTFVGTKDILTMYPVSKIKDRECIHLEERQKSNKKIKVRSGLERFKQKYNF